VTPLLQVEGLGVRFPLGSWPRRRWLRALHAVTLSVAPGEVVALVGASGSGKSTLARAIAGLVPEATGSVRLDGTELLHGGDAEAARRIQMVFQDPYASINPAHPAGHGVARALLLKGRATPSSVRAAVASAFEAVGLGADLAARAPQSLSGGQRQRVAIARALAAEPDLLLADEPTSMLDVSLRAEVLDLIVRHARAGGRGVVLVTHDLASAWRVADRAVVLCAGEVMEDGPADEVLVRPQHPYTQRLVAAARRDTRLDTPLPPYTGATP
jgi:peptide/nickel transport system ATP-binding protein